MLLVPAIGPLAFLFCHFRKALGPVLLMVLGGLVVGVPVVVNVINGDAVVTDAKVEQKPAEGGGETETHLTLTGSPREEYAKINAATNVVLLQWANKDVTDTDAESIKELKNLRDLDLNDTQITDASLDGIAGLPKLKTLRVARTKITDDGFKAKLQSLEGLDELDLTGTAVKPSTGRAWKTAKPGRKLLQ